MREKVVSYEHTPGEQWSVARLIRELQQFPPEDLVTVSFAVDGPHAKMVDEQPVTGIGRNTKRWSSDGPDVEDKAVSIYTDYEAGQYERFVREGDAEYYELEARGE